MLKFLKKRWYFLLAVLLIAVLLFASIKMNSDKQKKTKNSYQVKKEDLEENLSLSGEIDAEEKATLRFQSSGRLTWVGVKKGDVVKKHQVIASLDQRSLKKTLEKYLNTYAKERFDFEQSVDDNWQKQYALSLALRHEAERTLKNAQYDLNNAVLDVELQDISLQYANLWTPIEGVVTRVDSPYAGVNITPAQAEFEIVNPKTIYLSVTADQTEVVDLKPGMTGDIVFDSYPEQVFKGEVAEISFSPKEGETGTVYEVKVSFDIDKDFRLGMTGDIDFVTKKKKGIIAIPAAFIKKDKKGSYVKVEEAGQIKKRYIEVGEEIDGKTEVAGGLAAGEKIYD